MKIAIDNRASSVLFNFLVSNNIDGSVLMAANICETVPCVYMKAGLDVVFCDIDGKTFNPDKEQIRAILKNKRITVLHYSYTYGCVLQEDISFLKEIREQYTALIIVDDKCLCRPEKNQSSFSDLTLYSTGYSKYVNLGKGGYACFSNMYDIDNRIDNFSEEKLHMFENTVKACHVVSQRANLDVFLDNWLLHENYIESQYFKKIDEYLTKIDEHKKKINSLYLSLPGSFGREYQLWRYNLLLKNPEECKKELNRNGLFCSNHYMSLGNGYFSDTITERANFLEKHVINLFNDFCYTENQAKSTVEILEKIAIPMEF